MTDTPDTSPQAIAAWFLIRKHGGFYRPNSQGYTSSAIQAGRYTLDEAMDITHPNGPDGPRDGQGVIVSKHEWTALGDAIDQCNAALEVKQCTTITT